MDSRPSDEMLLLAVAERDMGAFRTLYERHADWLAIRLARRCNDRDLVADAASGHMVMRREGHSMIVSPNAHWCFADLLAVLCQLSTQVPALRQVI
jgi:hypothetical protein